MQRESIKLENGKYEVLVEDNGSKFYAKRHGLEWKDLTGDKLSMVMFYTIQELAEKVEHLETYIEVQEAKKDKRYSEEDVKGLIDLE